MTRLQPLVYALVLVAVVLSMSGCGRHAVLRKYYIIELPDPAGLSTRTTPVSDAACEILPVSVADAFASDRIAMRRDSYELTYYAYHQWAVPPGEATMQLIEQHLQDSRLFSSVSGRFWELLPDYRLQTRIHQLEVVRDDAGRLSAHLHVDYSLIERQTNTVVVFHDRDSIVPLPDRNMNAFAEAISGLLQQSLVDLSGKLEAHLVPENRAGDGED